MARCLGRTEEEISKHYKGHDNTLWLFPEKKPFRIRKTKKVNKTNEPNTKKIKARKVVPTSHHVVTVNIAHDSKSLLAKYEELIVKTEQLNSMLKDMPEVFVRIEDNMICLDVKVPLI